MANGFLGLSVYGLPWSKVARGCVPRSEAALRGRYLDVCSGWGFRALASSGSRGGFRALVSGVRASGSGFRA